MGLFDGTTYKLMEQGLDASWYKQQIISNNIANNDTYNFKAKTVSFGIVLDQAMGSDSEPSVKVETSCEENTNQTLNGNNVDMEKETLALADAQYQYSAMIDYMNAQYKMIRTAISK